jgi:hypothetical protein
VLQSLVDLNKFEGIINEGDMIELHPEMMLIDPQGPVLVLKADNAKQIYEVMYPSGYTIGVGDIDIKGIFSEAR